MSQCDHFDTFIFGFEIPGRMKNERGRNSTGDAGIVPSACLISQDFSEFDHHGPKDGGDEDGFHMRSRHKSRLVSRCRWICSPDSRCRIDIPYRIPLQERFIILPVEGQPDILANANSGPLRPPIGAPQDKGTGGTLDLEEEIILRIKTGLGSRR